MTNINGFYTNAVVYSDIISDEAYDQIRQICNHHAFRNANIRIMPDCHAGTGCVIGFTAVLAEKKIIPNIVGVDIGCGVMASVFRTTEPIDFHSLDNFIRSNIPSGMLFRDTSSEYFNTHPDIIADIDSICRIIKDKDRRENYVNSLGTLGGGNHFIEIDRITDDTYLLAVHTGSRSLGLHICKHFQKLGTTVDEELRQSILEKHKTASTPEEHLAIRNEADSLPQYDRELACISEEHYTNYIECMLKAMNFAYSNRECISDDIMNYLITHENAELVERFDTIHNYVNWYNDLHDSIIIRKGAISAESGQRVSIPLNMRDGIIVGTGKGNENWNRSAPHGAGRALSRSQARRTVSLEDYVDSMKDIATWSVSENTIDESPFAYKVSEDIIRQIEDTVDIDYIAKTVYNFKAE